MTACVSYRIVSKGPYVVCVKLTVGRPVASGDDTVYALLRPDLLAKCGDACICDERRVERVDAVPWRVSRVCAYVNVHFSSALELDELKKGVTFVRSIRPRGIAVRAMTRSPFLACRLLPGGTYMHG